MAMPNFYRVFLWEPTKTTTKSYPYLGLSRQNIDEAQYWQQYFLLVGTDIALVVTG